MQATTTKILLREAKRLHRAATSDSLSLALPILRRFIAVRVTPIIFLPDLFRQRHMLQRKHALRLLALEAGYPSWEAYRPALCQMDASQLEQFVVLEKGFANLNIWFSNETEALEFASENGGRVVRVGRQAVVMPALAVGPVCQRGG